MANVTVIVWKITQDYNSPHNTNGFVVGNYIHCILDDVALTLSVQIRNTASIGGGTLVASPGSGPQLFFVDGGTSSNNFTGTPTPQPFWSRCVSTTLQRISPNNLFPYASIGSTPNSSQCQITPVCDLTISDLYSVTAASGPAVADGSVTISATSSNGTIRYSLNPGFDYSSGQTSPIFSNLLPGDYTIYAKDPIGCTDEINISIPVTTVYGVHHRFEWAIVGPVSQRSRFDIEERAYTGAIDEPDFVGVPAFRLNSDPEGESIYDPIYYGDATLRLRTNTPFEWFNLSLGDDAQYKGKLYRFESSAWVLKHEGFILPSLPTEPYLNPPFDTEITLTDGIRSLKNKDFVDDDGNELRQRLSLLNVLTLILRKTNLKLSIRCAVDLIEQNMAATDDDDVFPQSFVDTRIFYSEKGDPDDCEKVLKNVLLSFGARIKSALGYYWIIRTENSTGDIEYRQFDYNGEFEESGTFNSAVLLRKQSALIPVFGSGCKFRDAVQQISLQQNYGTFKVIHDLMPDNNLIDSGSFELQYITETGGQLGFIDWNVFLGQSGLRYGFEAVKNGQSKGAFYFDLENANVAQVDNILYSKKLRVKSSVYDFSFDYLINPEFTNFPFVRIAYQVKAEPVSGGSALYLDKFGRWDPTIAHINELFITRYSAWQKFEQRIPAFTSVDPAGYDITISLYSHSHYGADASGSDAFASLKAIATTGQFSSGKRIYYNDTTNGLLRAYTLKQSFEAESLPDAIRPTDYSGGNQKVWFLDDSIDVGAGQSFVRKVLFDEVIFTQLVLILQPTTYYSDAPNPITYEVTANEFNKFEKSVNVLLGDTPTDEGALQATVPNPEVYRSWLSLADGTPTKDWNRRGVTETRALLNILLNDYRVQLQDKARLLDGVLMANNFISPIHSITDEDNDGKVYTILGYELEDRENACTVTLAEVVTGEAGEPPDYSEFTEEFSTEFL